MTRPKLQKGDEFATRNPMWLGRIITFSQKIKAIDNEATYSHAGIIINEDGTTLEALWTVKSQNLWQAYQGQHILIVRNKYMSNSVFTAGYNKIKKHIGQIYPFHRLVFHLLGIAKFIHWRRLVCSELVAKFEAGCAEYLSQTLGLDSKGFLRNWYGVNPDHLADRWLLSKYYDVVYQGIIQPDDSQPVSQDAPSPISAPHSALDTNYPDLQLNA